MRFADEGPTAIGAISQRNFASSSSFTICRLASALPPSEGFCVSKPVKATAITIGVEDLARSKRFYGEGLGCKIAQDHPNFVSFALRRIVVAGAVRTGRDGPRRRGLTATS